MAVNGKYLTREEILGANDLECIDVPVPEWGGVIRLRAMSAADREAYEAELSKLKEADALDNIRASLVAWCAVDGDGRRLFTTDRDLLALGAKSGVALVRLFDEARRLNGMNSDAPKQIEKNSDASTNGGSPSV